MVDHVGLPRAWGQLKWFMLHGIPGEEATGGTGCFSVCSCKILLQSNRIPSSSVCDVMQPRDCVVVDVTSNTLGVIRQSGKR